MQKSNTGELEGVALLIAVLVQNEAYGVTITQEIREGRSLLWDQIPPNALTT